MSLREDISKLIEQSSKNIPPETLNIMSADTERLKQSGIIDKNLKIGDKIPSFSLPNVKGETITSAELLNRGPLVLSFYRGGWWPYCNLELRALQLVLPEIESFGAQLVAVSPNLPDKSLSAAEKNDLTFEVLSDVRNHVAREFGLLFTLAENLRPIYESFGIDIPAFNGDDSFELPMPATYVIDTNGIITHVFVDPDYTRRLEPTEIVEIIKNMMKANK